MGSFGFGLIGYRIFWTEIVFFLVLIIWAVIYF